MCLVTFGWLPKMCQICPHTISIFQNSCFQDYIKKIPRKLIVWLSNIHICCEISDFNDQSCIFSPLCGYKMFYTDASQSRKHATSRGQHMLTSADIQYFPPHLKKDSLPSNKKWYQHAFKCYERCEKVYCITWNLPYLEAESPLL